MKVLLAGVRWHDNILKVMAQGVEANGHTAVIFDTNLKTRDLTLHKIAERTPFRGFSESRLERHRAEVSRRLLEFVEAERPDAMITVYGSNLYRKTIEEIRDVLKIPVGGYSRAFVIDDAWMPYLEYFNPGNIRYIPQVGDDSVFHPLGTPKTHDIGFGGALGLKMPNTPSGFLRAAILNAAAEAGFSVRAFAPGIRQTFSFYPALAKADYSDKYENHESLNRMYNSARIVLSIHSPQFKHGVSPRVFEAAFAGSFQLIEYEPDVEKLFPGGCAPTFKSNAEMVELARHYLAHPDEREHLAKTAHEHALAHHASKVRMREMLQMLVS